MSIISQVIAAHTGQAKLDWRDFITWRLNTENELIASRAESEWLKLYDHSEEAVLVAAYERYHANAPTQPQQVIEQQMQTAPDGQPQLRVTVRTESENESHEHIVRFNLVNKGWKRAS